MMASCSTIASTKKKNVGMGQIMVAQESGCLGAVLGSCVSVALYHKRLQLGAFAHVVLPDSGNRTGPPGKFANTAIPHMLRSLEARGARPAGLIAKIAGGACMFGANGPMQIGNDNVEAVTRALSAAGMRITGKDVGGSSGRRVSFDCSTGLLTINTVGNPPLTL